ncbi:MAG TPA: DUF885 domain-containing protein [Candidatus Dormibacteraeota bacterium]|nr:DUF885 domain-containing protein [Candidatus Dormibacteraeota bacterium]
MPAWEEVERAVIDGFFRFAPAHARTVGDHSYDGVVGDVSDTTIKARLEEIDRQLGNVTGCNRLDPPRDIDRRALQAHLEASRFELAEQRPAFKDPLYYAGSGSELDVSSYLKRAYAPIEERLAGLVRHLQGYPAYLEAARDNLDRSLPRPNLEVAIEAIAGQAAFLDGEVRSIVAKHSYIGEQIDAAVSLVREFGSFLRDRLPWAHDHDPLGAERFQRLLKLRERIDLDVASLQQLIDEDVARNSARAAELAQRIAPGEDVAAAVARLENDHPTREGILDDVTGMLEGIREFVLQRDICSIPAETRCSVKATPAYAAYITAALDSAGPLEVAARESYYYVTVPAETWGSARTEEWLRHLNYSVLVNTSIHEAYPGHYVQALHERGASSLTRKVFWVQGTGEGYAHYCEEMMIEAGFSSDARLELAQVMDALLRDCRALVALGLHCRGMTIAEAVEVFMRVGFLSELPATREAKRGAWDPLYLTYTLGKILIYELRRECEQLPGYSLKKFHDAFLACGNLPIPLIREQLV